MIDKFDTEISIDRFNFSIDKVKNSEDFNESITLLRQCDDYIDYIEHLIKCMKQERHDLTQDVYNKFKNKGYVKSIKY